MPTLPRTKAEQAEALAYLRELIQPGDTIHTVLRHRSASGMSRSIDLYLFRPDGNDPRIIVKFWLSAQAATALGMRYDEKRECIRVGGCGMDMGFHLVYNLSSALFPEGFACVGKGRGNRGRRCPSNDHSNGDQNYRKHKHGSGGYALRHEWIG
jgi:hypothetical protein